MPPRKRWSLWAMRHSNIAIFVPHKGCPQQCSFCNQRTISGTALPPSPKDVRELLTGALAGVKDRKNAEIAFFGGSFTAIDRQEMVALLEAASEFVGPEGFSGIRISTRPDAIGREVLAILKRYGVTSIELGAQSMDDEVLAANRRGHTAEDVRRASRLIREAGFSLGLQMMVGLYRDTADGAERTAEELILLEPDTVRIYPTVILRGTRLAELYCQKEYQPMTLSAAVELCAGLLLKFEQAGVRVIRLGLHASPEIEREMLAGLYHPAFRELCESRIYRNRAEALLKELPLEKCGREITLSVNSRAVSKMIGQNRCNLLELEKPGWKIRVRGDSSLALYEIGMEKDVRVCF